MAYVWQVAVDMAGNELRNAIIGVQASAPGSPSEGQIYFDSTLNVLRQYSDEDGWENLVAAKAADGTISLAKLTTDPLARGNHTGTQLASTISDLGTTIRAVRLDEFAVPTADLAINGQKITGIAAATADTDVPNYRQVLDLAQQRDFKDSVRVATTANITLSGAQTIDGVSAVAGNRVLVKNQTDGTQNGIYVVAAGAWSRATDADASDKVTPGLVVPVEEGTANDNTLWMLTTNAPITLGTTALTFAQFGGGGEIITAGDGLTKTGSTLDVGAGTGIAVTADAVAVDTALVARKKDFVIGDAAATSFVLNHALGNQWCTVQVFQNGTPFAMVGVDVELTDANNATVRFATAPAASAYHAVVTG